MKEQQKKVLQLNKELYSREVIESARKEYGQVCQTALTETENYYVCTFLNTRHDLEMTQKEFEDYLIGRMWQDGA